MIKRRLRILAERLEKIEATPKEKRVREFDISCWIDIPFDCSGDCKTAACALGEACFIPELKALGLRALQGTPRFRDRFGIDAAVLFFRIDELTARWLFMRMSYTHSFATTAGDVAARIRELIA